MTHRKCTLSPSSLTLLEHLHQHGACTMRQLKERLDGVVSRQNIHKCLQNLCAGGWLDYEVDQHGAQQWLIPASARRAVAAALAATAEPEPPNIAPPRRINVMQSHYQPRAWQPSRPGAQDHLAVPSLRDAQRVAHQGTYLFR